MNEKKLKDVTPDEMTTKIVAIASKKLSTENIALDPLAAISEFGSLVQAELKLWHSEIAQDDLLACDHHIDFLEVIQYNNSLFIQCSKCALACPIHHTDNWMVLPDE